MRFRSRIAVWGLVIVAAQVLPTGSSYQSGTAYAFHFPWDQGHDTFKPTPPGDETECPDEDNRCQTAKPVDIGAGDKIQRYVDFAFPDFGPPLALIRTYHSQDFTNGPFGFGWHTNLTTRLVLVTDGTGFTAIVVHGDGKRKRFALQGDGTWASAPGTFQTLSVAADGSAQLRDRDGMTYFFNRFGRLFKIEDRNANSLIITYDAQGVIASARAASGRTLTFTRGADGRIASVTDPLGRRFQYFYDASGLMARVVDPAGGEVRYAYTGNNLQRVVDARGNNAVTLTYDGSDRVIREVLADGATYQFNYVSSTQTRVTNARGFQTLFTFNSTGQPIEIRDPLNRTTRSTWDANFNRLSHTDGNGRTTTFAYDANGNLIRATDVLSQVTQFTYEPIFSQVTSETDAEGNVTRFEYDARGNLTKIIDAPNNRADLTYDGQGRLTSATDPLGNTTTYSYDGAGNLTLVTDALGNTATMVFDAVGNLTRITDAEGRTTQFEYDGLNRRTKIIDSAGGQTTFTYDPNGNMTSVTDPRGGTATYSYDSRNRLVRTTNALAQAENRTYDLNGNLITLTDVAGNTRTYAYDSGDQLVTETLPGAALYRYEYDNAGNQTAVTDPTGVRVAQSYDTVNRLTALVHSNGDREAYSYDRVDNQTGTVRRNGSGQVFFNETIAYDALDQAVKLVAGMGQTTDLGYDANGNLTKLTDALGRITSLAYDALDRIVGLTDAAGGITRYAYGRVGNLTNVTDPRGLVVGYSYDTLNRQIHLNSPDTGIDTAEYDGNGNITKQSDSRGVTVAHAYDAVNRRTASTFPTPGENRIFLYDQGANGTGQLAGYDDESGQTRFAYDGRGNVISETRIIQGRTYRVGNAYNGADRLTTQTYPSGLAVTYSYDSQGRVQSITAGGQPVLSSIVYLPFGPANTWTDGSGLVHRETFDTDYRPTAITVGSIQGLGYVHNLADNITDWTDVVEAANSQHFAYDAIDRLTDADGRYGSIDLTYDAVGNRLSKTIGAGLTNYTYAAASNRLQTASGAEPGTYTYDAAGNLIRDDRFSYVYNQANRLAEVRQGGAPIATYTYNAEGQRVVKTAAGQTTHFIYGPGGQLIGVYDGATGTPIEEIIYFGDAPAASTRGGSLSYIHTDHLGVPRLVSDTSQTVVWRWNSDPFGEALPDQDPDGDGTPLVFNLRFPGQFFDAETGRHYNYFRDYDPATARYVQSDPIGIVGGLNTYAYVDSNPVSYTDPAGLCGPPCVAAFGAYLRCLAECAAIEAAVGALNCESLTAAAVTCAADCLNPINWLPGSKVFKNAKRARDLLKRLDKTLEKAKGALNPKVRDALKKGQQAHKAQKYPPGFRKEVKLPSGKRIDAYNKETKEIIELKPNNPRAIERGQKQVEKYCAECDRVNGPGHSGKVQTYE